MRFGLYVVVLLALTKPSQASLKILPYNPINVDVSKGTAATHVRLRNTGDEDVTCTLTLKDFRSKNTGKFNRSAANFYKDDKLTGPTLDIAALPPEKSIEVRVEFEHLVEAGESEAELYCDDQKIGVLKAKKELGLPLKVSLLGNPSEKPMISLIKGQNIEVSLKNDDLVTYPVTWVFSTKGTSVSGTTTLLPNGVTNIRITPDVNWFSQYESLFKPERSDGKLLVRYDPTGSVSSNSSPAKVFPVTASLSWWPNGSGDLWSTAIILFFLALGGLVSVYLNIDLVNRLRRVRLGNRLGNLAGKAGLIAPQLGSRLRVALLLERSRISGVLPDSGFFTPGTATNLGKCKTDTDSLEARIESAAQVSRARLRQNDAMARAALAPTLLDRIADSLADAESLVEKSALTVGEVATIEKLIGQATSLLDNIGKPDTQLEGELTKRLQDARTKFAQVPQDDLILVAVKNATATSFRLLDTAIPTPSSQADRDLRLRQLDVIYAVIEMQRQPDDVMLACLRRQDIDSLRSAELLLREWKEEIKPQDIKNAIRADLPELFIQIDRNVVRVKQSVMMRIVFHNSRYAHAAAKRSIECAWNFGHQNLAEHGWEVYHYFPDPGAIKVNVTFKGENKVEIPLKKTVELQFDVKPQRAVEKSPTVVEAQRFAVAFLVAVLMLFAGAKEKIVNLDTLGAIFAVFLLGFTIDMAKNLLVAKEPQTNQ